MNILLERIKTIVSANLCFSLPQVKTSDLEDEGAIFCMNGNNGVEFEWYVNEKLPDFMVFYDDDEKLGAVKLTVYTDGNVLLYLYKDHGKNIAEEIQTIISVPKEELLEFAVALKKLEDKESVFDPNIDSIANLPDVSDEEKKEFLEHRKFFEEMIERKKIIGQFAYVSKKVIEEGCKIGFMERDEPVNENDSGWMFMAGDEDEEYTNDADNIKLLSVGYVWQNIDKAIWKYITEPVGSSLVRVSEDEFAANN